LSGGYLACASALAKKYGILHMPTAQAEAHSLARAREAGAVPFENTFAWTLD
jgi:hypothetical protein